MAIYSIANVDVGTYLTVVLVLIVFSEYLPLFEYCFFGYCFPVKFARERIQFLTDHLKDLFLSSVCVCACAYACIIMLYIYIFFFSKQENICYEVGNSQHGPMQRYTPDFSILNGAASRFAKWCKVSTLSVPVLESMWGMDLSYFPLIIAIWGISKILWWDPGSCTRM